MEFKQDYAVHAIYYLIQNTLRKVKKREMWPILPGRNKIMEHVTEILLSKRDLKVNRNLYCNWCFTPSNFHSSKP